MRPSSLTSGRGFSRTTPHDEQRTKVNSSSVVLAYSCSCPDQSNSPSGAPQWPQGASTFFTGLAGPAVIWRSVRKGAGVAPDGLAVGGAHQHRRGAFAPAHPLLELLELRSGNRRRQVVLRVVVHVVGRNQG